MSFAVPQNEIFGLLGPNGAGKSTTFNMLTLDLSRSEGRIELLGKDIFMDDMKGVLPQIGICPQANAIWSKLTVNEHLVTIGRVKGLEPNEI